MKNNMALIAKIDANGKGRKMSVFMVSPPDDPLYQSSNIHLFKFLSKDIRHNKSIHPPVMGLAAISANVVNKGHKVKIFDLNVPANKEKLAAALKDEKPDFVCITFTTVLFNEMLKIAELVTEYSPSSVMIGGGPHASSFPEITLRDAPLDIVVVGEGDFTVSEIIDGEPLEKMKGVAFKSDGKITVNPRREPIENLDTLPMPAWQIYDLSQYDIPKAVSLKRKVGWLETSRGCLWGCVYCNKSVFGRTFRPKSPCRVVEEIKRMLDLGFEELHITDDGFTTIIPRAEEICHKIIDENIKFPWATMNGIRADRVNLPLLKKMKQAGCYRVFYGVESGNNQVLKRINKGEDLQTIKNAIEMTKQAGIEAYGFFMLGLPGDTEETMKDTIRFAKSLKLDMAKVSITSPLPATPLYEECKKGGRLLSEDWSQYNLYTSPRHLYKHESLSWDTIEKYYNEFYREFYLDPSFIVRKMKSSIKNGTVGSDMSLFLSYVKSQMSTKSKKK